MNDVGGEVRLGSMLFTLVEPHPGHEVAYNRWYERDHFYAGCMVGPWLFAGRRWVATRALKDLRFGAEPELFGGARLGSYLAVYWILEGRHDEHTDWALRQVRWLHDNGRMFGERDHVHTLMYRHERTATGPDDGVPAELALDHPFGGLVATVLEPAVGSGAADVGARLAASQVGDLDLLFSPIPLPDGAPVTQRGMERALGCVLLLSFTAGSPAERWVEHRAALGRLAHGEAARVLWSAPFVPTIPGTDAYTDQL